MKKIVFLAAALMASMFILTSCEKENVAEMIENNEGMPINFVLQQKGYVDKDGNAGDLYVDENNSSNMYLEIYEHQVQSKACTNPGDKNDWTGTLVVKYKKVDGEFVVSDVKCVEDVAKDCRNMVDENGKTIWESSRKLADIQKK